MSMERRRWAKEMTINCGLWRRNRMPGESSALLWIHPLWMTRWENNQQRNKIVCYSWARPMQVSSSERKVDFAFFYWMIMRSSEDKAGRRWRERERETKKHLERKNWLEVYNEIGKCVLDIDRRFWTNTSSARRERRKRQVFYVWAWRI